MDKLDRVLMDFLSILTVTGTLFRILPEIAAGVTLLWTLIRIYETKTVQNLLKRKKKGVDDG